VAKYPCQTQESKIERCNEKKKNNRGVVLRGSEGCVGKKKTNWAEGRGGESLTISGTEVNLIALNFSKHQKPYCGVWLMIRAGKRTAEGPFIWKEKPRRLGTH